jgi:hypothetical protein
MIKYGLDKETNKPLFIDDAERGLNCNCICIECGDTLVANKGEKISKFFDHYLPSGCTGAPEKAIHLLAKIFIAENNKIQSPKGIIHYDEVFIEKHLGFLCPDVTIISNGEKICIEIFVTNKKKEKQINLYKENNLKCFEINLSQVSYDISPENLKELVLDELFNRELIYWGEEAVTPVIEQPPILADSPAEYEQPHESIFTKVISFLRSNPLATFVIFIILLFVGHKLLFSSSRKSRRF